MFFNTPPQRILFKRVVKYQQIRQKYKKYRILRYGTYSNINHFYSILAVRNNSLQTTLFRKEERKQFM